MMVMSKPCISRPCLVLEGLADLVVGGEDDRQWDKESKGVDVSHIGELVKHHRDACDDNGDDGDVDNVDDLVKEAGIALSLPDNPTTDPKKSPKLILKNSVGLVFHFHICLKKSSLPT